KQPKQHATRVGQKTNGCGGPATPPQPPPAGAHDSRNCRKFLTFWMFETRTQGTANLDFSPPNGGFFGVSPVPPGRPAAQRYITGRRGHSFSEGPITPHA